MQKLIIGAVVLFLIAIFIVIPVAFFVGIPYPTGNGTHVGYITAIERNGIIFKTGKAYVKSDTQSSQEDTYCVIDPVVYDHLKSAAEKKEKVEVTYYSVLSAGIAHCDGEGAIISSIREL